MVVQNEHKSLIVCGINAKIVSVKHIKKSNTYASNLLCNGRRVEKQINSFELTNCGNYNSSSQGWVEKGRREKQSSSSIEQRNPH